MDKTQAIDLEQFHDVVVGRELKMMDLENELQQLRADLAAAREKDKGGRP